ncbi:MAG TPA: tRNA preQ1(34) S-adenosylmethionine ribosyltransferase-isomerase QueA [Fimbriimonas sp.]|nr:tRNA preQ1(34) S-adenosylmethionine ribosyltransferase-isomerase QueA [Fimbriimonas sp.]
MPFLSDYDYDLPPELIAQTPLEDRAASRLLVLDRKTGAIQHRLFGEVPQILRPGDLLVMNDTRVTALRLWGRKETGGEVEALLLRETEPGRFEALMKPARRLRKGATVVFGGLVRAIVDDELDDGIRLLQFEQGEDLAERLAAIGQTPLPPYITERLSDPERYQTVFARQSGSSAAPTAGLHFTPEMLKELEEKGVDTATVTLDVGIDTFRPVGVENLDEHRMHGERCSVPVETKAKIESCTGRIVAVGTTSVRTLESFATGYRKIASGSSIATLFIQPGFEFKIVTGMFTNFHLPKTTMLIMISALCKREQVLVAYEEAVRQNYRFLSFGDSMLIL